MSMTPAKRKWALEQLQKNVSVESVLLGLTNQSEPQPQPQTEPTAPVQPTTPQPQPASTSREESLMQCVRDLLSAMSSTDITCRNVAVEKATSLLASCESKPEGAKKTFNFPLIINR